MFRWVCSNESGVLTTFSKIHKKRETRYLVQIGFPLKNGMCKFWKSPFPITFHSVSIKHTKFYAKSFSANVSYSFGVLLSNSNLYQYTDALK